MSIQIPESYILSNRKGSFFLWTKKPYSKFCGFHCNINGTFVKVLEQISIHSPLEQVNNEQIALVNKRKEYTETIYIPEKENVLSYQLSRPEPITLILDVHKENDFNEWGRSYTIYKEKEIIIIEFKKEENDSTYQYFLAIKANNPKYDSIQKYKEVEYEYDKYRNSDYKRHVFEALILHTSHFTLGISDKKEEAIKLAEQLYQNYDKVLEQDKRGKISFTSLVPNSSGKAYKEAHYALNKLVTNSGILAGFPWFYQEWSRDELICLKYLIDQKEYKTIINIFRKYSTEKNYDGRLYAIYPKRGNKSADAGGWLALRFLQFYNQLQTENKWKQFAKKWDVKKMILFLENLLFHLEKYHKEKGLIFSGKDETWMDTSAEEEERVGYCLEIQALTLTMYKVIYILTKKERYKEEEEEMKKTVVKQFFNENSLADYITKEGVKNTTVRPNIFIAYYVYPELLSKKGWEQVFDNAIEKLWLTWGGFASIDKKDPLFIEEYTGENNKSYHRGDSWFYLNCIAGICMQRLNKEKYQKYINKIISACTAESLFNGVIGSIAEVSSANKLTGVGCLSQAWSLAMFIELIDQKENER